MKCKLLYPLLIASLLLSACHSYTRYRPKVDTTSSRSDAQVCIAECRENTAGKNEFYACLEGCPSLVKQSGQCSSSMLVCEDDKDLDAGKALGGVGVVVLVVVGVVALTAALVIGGIPRP